MLTITDDIIFFHPPLSSEAFGLLLHGGGKDVEKLLAVVELGVANSSKLKRYLREAQKLLNFFAA